MALTKKETEIVSNLIQRLRDEPPNAIAATYGVPTDNIYKLRGLLSKAGVDVPVQRHGRIDRDELSSLVKSGVKTNDIAAHFGTSASVICRLKAQLGIRSPKVSDVLAARKAAE